MLLQTRTTSVGLSKHACFEFGRKTVWYKLSEWWWWDAGDDGDTGDDCYHGELSCCANGAVAMCLHRCQISPVIVMGVAIRLVGDISANDVGKCFLSLPRRIKLSYLVNRKWKSCYYKFTHVQCLLRALRQSWPKSCNHWSRCLIDWCYIFDLFSKKAEQFQPLNSLGAQKKTKKHLISEFDMWICIIVCMTFFLSLLSIYKRTVRSSKNYAISSK